MSIDLQPALRQVKYPGFSRDIVSFGLVQEATVDAAGVAHVRLQVTTSDPKVPRLLAEAVEAAVRQVPGVKQAEVRVVTQAPKAAPAAPGAAAGGPKAAPGIRYAIAIASGKGGVGKSTFAVNLACALARLPGQVPPLRVGLLDCDIYGPSVPLMIGLNERPEFDEARNMILPISNFGVRVMSMGLLVDENTPVVWRGPMVNKTIVQFVQNVDWGELDILLVDLPPGTGDAHLSICQTIALHGAVVVTTPQAAAVNVARRGAMMFEKVNVPLLGVAENMSYQLDALGQRSYIFGQGGGASAAAGLGCPLLGQVPLDPLIREGGDHGVPVVVGAPRSGPALAFQQIAASVWDALRHPKRP